MAGLCWMAVMLAFLLSVPKNSLADDYNGRLPQIVNGILRGYGVQGMFSLAVRIPKNQNQNQNINQILNQVFTSDPADNVKNTMNSGGVYTGSRVVAAKVQRHVTGGADHAESRVVDHFNHLLNTRNDNDFLLFYVYASPCVEKCTSRTHNDNILQRMNQILEWDSYAVVFSKIFKPKTGPANTDEQRSGALQQLGTYQGNRGQIGLNNIFRCDKRANQMQCSVCSSGNGVAHYCVSDGTGGGSGTG
ncbi:uncharacterized protein LOC111649340 [Seriola lalandi dorsalis]|uniref:uncharacterized protein LOC111649340 n=1 Tax=Seriola lalandi dorsalis TaxID=1841481 RepID=UPI000C6F9560|nr:uncharacterized protein LOC111649340 [Seriola lalandi dorsalis]